MQKVRNGTSDDYFVKTAADPSQTPGESHDSEPQLMRRY